MMTFRGDGVVVNYNSDLSGKCLVCTGEDAVEVPCEALLGLVAEWVRSAHIAALGSLTPRAVLGVPPLMTREALEGAIAELRR